MIFKKSLENIFRSRIKSILFFLLIAVVSAMLAISLGVWISVSGFLDECDENYKTIALLEYMGTEYPDITILDEGMQEAVSNFDFSMIAENENVLLWDRSEKAIGYVDGYKRTDKDAPYRAGAVMVIGDIWETSRYISIGTVVFETIYSVEDNTDTVVLVENPDFEWEKDHFYLVHGDYVFGKTSYEYIKTRKFKNGTAEKSGFTDWESTRIVDITTADGRYEMDPDSAFYKIAETYEVLNNSLMVTETSDLYSLLPFNQQNLFIKYGRTFTESEYENSSRVCIVSEAFATKMKYSIGDSIDVSIAVSENTAPYESYWVDSGFQYKNSYEIVGITNTHRDLLHHLFIPRDDEMDLYVNQIGYTLGQALLKNGTADEFYKEITPLLAERMRVTVYDQGYAEVAEPFRDIRRLAGIVSVAGIMTALAVIILFGFSFVYRQRDVSDIMMKLGAGKKKIYRYFLYSSGFLSAAAVLVGSVTAYILSGKVGQLVIKMAEGYKLSDKRYSIGNLSIVKELGFSAEQSYWIYLAIAGMVLLLALISCVFFIRQTFITIRKKRKKPVRHRTGHTIRLRGAGFKYAVASIIRGGSRTLVVPIVCALTVVFLGQLASTSASYSERLYDIAEESVIRGHFTDIDGKLTDNVVIDSFIVREMHESGFVEELLFSKALDFHYQGISARKGEPVGLEPLVLPRSFSLETFMDQLRMGADIVYTNSLKSTPEFFYSTKVETKFMEGYDETFFELDAEDEHLCIISETMMEEEGIGFGDSLRVYIPDYPDYKKKFMDIKVIGSFVRQAQKNNIYCQMKGYYDFDEIYDVRKTGKGITFDAVDFKLVSAAEIDDFKEWLDEYGLSEATRLDKYRTFLVIEDINYNSTIDMLRQQIRYINVLYPFLYVLVGLVALIISYLMVVSRRREFAIMRGLGADRIKAFMSFFIEQGILCLGGSSAGFIIGRILGTPLTALYLGLLAGYVVLYLVGSIASVLIMNNIKVSAILKYED